MKPVFFVLISHQTPVLEVGRDSPVQSTFFFSPSEETKYLYNLFEIHKKKKKALEDPIITKASIKTNGTVKAGILTFKV